MLVLVNGVLQSFFNCSRGVRQGDPLSPLLFRLVENVLSRLISVVVNSCSTSQIRGPRNVLVRSHIFYADYVIIFYKVSIANLNNLISIYQSYAEGAMSHSRLNVLDYLLGFNMGICHFVFLGVHIFKGKTHYNPQIYPAITMKIIVQKSLNTHHI